MEPLKPQGWYLDPYSVHEHRYFSDGQPTKLVRDHDSECFDEPPAGPAEELVEVPYDPPLAGQDLLRVDDLPPAEDCTMFQMALDAEVEGAGPLPEPYPTHIG